MRVLVLLATVQCLWISPALAQVDLGIGGGLVKSSELSHAWLTGDLRLRVWKALAIQPEFGRWAETTKGPTYEDHTSTIVVSTALVAVAPIGGRTSCFVGIGGALHTTSFRNTELGHADTSGSNTHPSIYGVIGLEVGFAHRLSAFISMRRDQIANGDDPYAETRYYGGLRVRLLH